MSAVTLEGKPAGASANAAPARLLVRDVFLTLGKRVVLDAISFEARPGEIFGILGPNGSGKTSLLRCLAGTLRPDRGSFWLDGEVLDERARYRRAHIGVVFQEPSLDGKLTARENLLLGAALFGVRGAEARRRAAELLSFMELSDRADDPAGILSGGNRRRLELARALISQPRLLLLDEPTVGLDMIAFDRIWFLLERLQALQDLAILLSTHRADEAERCDRLVLIDRGHLVAWDTPQHLLARLAGDVITLSASAPAELAERLRRELGLRAELVDGQVQVEAQRGHELIPRLVEAIEPGRLQAIALRRPSLADAFYQLTGRSFSEATRTVPGDAS